MYRTRSERRASKLIHHERDRRITKIPQYNISIWWDEQKGRIVHPGRGAGSHMIKKNCSRTLRRKMKQGLEFGNGNQYRRFTEFWWTLY